MNKTTEKMKLITYLFNKGQNYKCLKLLEEYLEETEEILEPTLMMCEILVRENYYDKAEKVLRDLIRIYPTCGKIYYIYGNIMLTRNNYEDAERLYYLAIELGFVSARLILNLETVKKASGKTKECREILENSRKFLDEEVYFKLQGDINLYQNNLQEACVAYEKSGKIGRSGIYSVALMYYIQGEIVNFQKALIKIQEQNYKDSIYYDALFTRALINRIQDNSDESLIELNEVLFKELQNKKDFFEVLHIYILLAVSFGLQKKYSELLRLVEDLESVVGNNDISDSFKLFIMENLESNKMRNQQNRSDVNIDAIVELDSNDEMVKFFVKYINNN